MSRKPMPKNTLSAGQRAAMFEQQQKIRNAQLSGEKYEKNGDVFPENNDFTQRDNPVCVNITETKSAPPKRKEKPQIQTVKVDLGVNAGHVKKLHGVCNGPISQSADISGLLKDIKVPYIRFDKTEGARSGYVVDISKVFPNMDADERDPQSYSFRQTDIHMFAASNTGAKIIFRLGESFDAGTPDHKFKLYSNYDKITTVCVNVIKHYNDYWANGFALGIEYFEVLSHTDMQAVREANTDAEIFELYARISNGIKLYDEKLKVGGMSFSSPSQFVRDFIRECKKRSAPIDFLSVSLYESSPEIMGEHIDQYVHMLKNSSYANAEIIVSEWAYTPSKDGNTDFWRESISNSASNAEQKKNFFESQKNIYGAAFVAAGLLKLSEYPEISAACLYSADADSLWCAICDRYGIPQKTYYALDSIAKLVSFEDKLICICERDEQYAHSGIYAAACGADGGASVLIAAFDGCTSVDLRLDNIPDNLYTADIYMLDGVKNMELCHSMPLAGMKKRMVLNVSPYSVVFVKMY